MKQEITFEGQAITRDNVGDLNIEWGRVLDDIRAGAKMTLKSISEKTGISISKITHASNRDFAKFCKCERMEILSIYDDICNK